MSLPGEPIGATILAYVIFDEGLTASKIMGGIFILTAIYIAASAENRKSQLKECELCHRINKFVFFLADKTRKPNFQPINWILNLTKFVWSLI